ncbi:MAG TPA: DUF533 domain-containing protein [Methylotenera sp.]|jgi:uncharacterized protein (DUF697 family)/tellurite resistance protein|nr:DUF533 domain-containing protein [Methylotenera sp.]
MSLEQQQAILTIALFAAFADGENNDQEREQIRALAQSLAKEKGLALIPKIYQEVLLKKINLEEVSTSLTEAEYRKLAYEMAVCVCDADGMTTASERAFLSELAKLLQLDQSVTVAANENAESVAALTSSVAPMSQQDKDVNELDTPILSTTPIPLEADVDRSILKSSILNGALELLPQSWASMAIIPLQIKMVYSIGRGYGYELDQGHIRELMATIGVGLTSQYLEQFGRKLLGGLFGGVAGGFGKQLGKATTSIAFSFATTYALGQVAKSYYSGGRVMNASLLRESFQKILEPAKKLQSQYIPQIQQRASNLDMSEIMNVVRGV